MKTEIETSVEELLHDIERVESALVQLENELQTRANPVIQQTLLGQIHYGAYGKQASGLFSTSLGILFRIRIYKKTAPVCDNKIIGYLEGASIMLANCCEEFSRVCFNIARWKQESLHQMEFSWEDKVWERYGQFREEYHKRFVSLRSQESKVSSMRGFTDIAVLIVLALLASIAGGMAFLHKDAPPAAPITPEPVSATSAQPLPEKKAEVDAPVAPTPKTKPSVEVAIPVEDNESNKVGDREQKIRELEQAANGWRSAPAETIEEFTYRGIRVKLLKVDLDNYYRYEFTDLAGTFFTNRTVSNKDEEAIFLLTREAKAEINESAVAE